MASGKSVAKFLHRQPAWVYCSGAGGRHLAKLFWEKGINKNIPRHYKEFYELWRQGPREHIHSQPGTARFEKDEWGEIHPVQHPRIYVVYPDQFHNGLWGGEGVIKGLLARPPTRHRSFVPPAAKYWWPQLFEGVVYSEILDKHIDMVMTKRGARLVDECLGFDNYLLSTPVNEIYALRLLRLKRELLLHLCDKDNFAGRKKSKDIYEKYQNFVVPHEVADWTGLTLQEAQNKQTAIEEIEKERSMVPHKDKFRAELVGLLRSGQLDELDLDLVEDDGQSKGGGPLSGIKSFFK